MNKSLKPILEIQELDMQMIQLMHLKKERQKELQNIYHIRDDLQKQVVIKENEILELKKNVRFGELDIEEINNKVKKLESQQHAIKKVDEFNALTHEMAHAKREKSAKEQRLSDIYDKVVGEEELLNNLKQTLNTTVESSQMLEREISQRIQMINEEGRVLKERRDGLIKESDPEVFRIYERLLRNKRDRVVVPIENRCCSGCHIMLTAQDENLVRKGERLVFCEHCSRIHFWPESDDLGSTAVTKTRRRRSNAKV